MARLAVVEVIEDNLLFPHLLILLGLFLCSHLAICGTFTRRKQSGAPFLLPCPRIAASGKFCFSRCIQTLAPDVECWELLLMFVLFLTFLRLLRACRQYPRCSRGALSAAPVRRMPLSPGDTLSFQVEEARTEGHPVLGFRGRLLRIMHNSWPL